MFHEKLLQRRSQDSKHFALENESATVIAMQCKQTRSGGTVLWPVSMSPRSCLFQEILDVN